MAPDRSLASCFVLTIGGMLLGCGEPATEAGSVRPVRAIKVGDLKAIQGREFPGRAKAKDEVDLSFHVAGPLIALPVDVGARLKKGDVIAQIDPRDFQAALANAQGTLEQSRANLLAMERGARTEEIAQLEAVLQQAEASYRQAAAEHERNAKLLPGKVVSRSEYDITLARAQRASAEVRKAKEDLSIGRSGARPEDLEAKRSEIRALEAAVDAAQNELDYTTLTAPFDGEVASRYVDNFQTVQAKEPIARLLDVSTIEVTVQVPESLISLVPQVKGIVCRFDAFPDREFTGRVTKIGSEASQTTRTYPVTVQVDQPDDVRILPGMAAVVRNRPEDAGSAARWDLIVPPGAIFTADAGPETYVWIVDEGSQTVKRRLVKTGQLTTGGFAITEGLSSGEWVVSTGVNSLREGQAVKLLQESS